MSNEDIKDEFQRTPRIIAYRNGQFIIETEVSQEDAIQNEKYGKTFARMAKQYKFFSRDRWEEE